MKIRAQIAMVLNLDLASTAGQEPLPPGPSLPSGERDDFSNALVFGI
ncbi:MAG TPA: hypothetical protein VH881_03415 [Burkholderiales bacterium]|jgi:hypothetical protein